MAPTDPARPTKNQRRAAARERAREAAAAARRRERRTKVLVRGGIAAGVVAVVAVVAVLVTSTATTPVQMPRNVAGDGITIGKELKQVAATSAKVPATATAVATATATPTATPTGSSTATPSAAEPLDIRLYTDFLCPSCKAFEDENGAYIEKLVTAGAATVEYHPIAILDRFSLGSNYSTRSAAAAACVADLSPDSYYRFNEALYKRQPAENTRGLVNADIAAVATNLPGLANSKRVAECIDDQRFSKWAEQATKRAVSEPLPGTDVKQLTGTPTVTVNGRQFDSSKQTFTEFVASFGSGEPAGS